MVTNRDDDYLICKHYYNHINDVSAEYKDFITFEHNENYYFAWVNEGKVILRSEAYPSAEKMERGIKAIIKNRDINARYSIDTQHGVNFLVLWGGGDHQKHTGNMQSHNEIGRSCPVKTKDELYAMMGFMGKDFVKKTFHYGGVSKSASIAAATAGAASIAATSKAKTTKTTKTTATATKGAAAHASATSSSGGGFKWWYLLPLLLIPMFFMWKGCGADTGAVKAKVKTEATAVKAKVDAAAIAAKKEAKELADAAAKLKADAAAKLAAEAEAAKAKVNKGGSGKTTNRSSNNNIDFGGNKSTGY